MFSINCLEILKDCPENLRKCLKADRYYFNDRIRINKNDVLCKNDKSTSVVIPNFWDDSKKIHVQAIVGKNGSGKSSLLDLMYMAINNFAYMFERGYERGGAESLCFVKHLNVKLYYEVDEQYYVLACSDETVTLTSLVVGKCVLEGTLVADGFFEIGKNHKKITKLDELSVKTLLSHFFYTVVSNYSLQSFIASNYKCDLFVHNLNTHEDDNPENVNSYGHRWNEKRDKNDSKEKIWINSVFHKNDGYIRSLCLNPYRNNGVINAAQELELSKERLVALVIKDKRLDERYSLKRIDATINVEKCSEICKYYKNLFKKTYPRRNFLQYTYECSVPRREMEWLQWVFLCKNSRFRMLIQKFSLNVTEESSEYKLIGLAYLYKKICKIIQIYSCYHKYKDFCPKNGKMNFSSFDKIDDLVTQINDDPSHVAAKVHRMIHFLRLNDSAVKDSFDVEKYLENFSRYKKFDLDEIMDHLPPSIYSMDIILKDKYGVIPYTKLSSGEQQMLQNISTHLYHVRNLISIQNADSMNPDPNRPIYRNVNLIFDEVEISFHPEYQRKFIYLLVGMLARYTDHCSFNVFIVSHSPFILSDFPNKNILYLEEGEIVDKTRDKTFGANINDLCKDSFFLKYGFVGEYAKGCVSSLVAFLKKGPKTTEFRGWNEEKAHKFINEIVGERIVQECLIRMFELKFGKEYEKNSI